MKTIFFIIGSLTLLMIISGVTSSVISEAFKSFATRHHHKNKRVVSREDFIRRQQKLAETMKMVSSLGRFRALGPEPRSDNVIVEEFLDGFDDSNDILEPFLHEHEIMTGRSKEDQELLDKVDDLEMFIEDSLEEIMPSTDESILLSKLSMFDDTPEVNETDVPEKVSETEADVANKTQGNFEEEISMFSDAPRVNNETDVPEEVSETEIDVSNKTQGNSGEESPKDNVEQHPVIKSNQQKESLDVAQDRSDIISERMQEIIVGGDGGEMENFEDVAEEVFETETDVANKTQGNSGEESPKNKVEPEVKETDVSEEVSETETNVANKTQGNSGEESPKVKLEPEVKETDVSEEASETETDVPMKTQQKSGEETPKVKAERPANVASFLTTFINTFG